MRTGEKKSSNLTVEHVEECRIRKTMYDALAFRASGEGRGLLKAVCSDLSGQEYEENL
jgi:hypothetical protein